MDEFKKEVIAIRNILTKCDRSRKILLETQTKIIDCFNEWEEKLDHE